MRIEDLLLDKSVEMGLFVHKYINGFIKLLLLLERILLPSILKVTAMTVNLARLHRE